MDRGHQVRGSRDSGHLLSPSDVVGGLLSLSIKEQTPDLPPVGWPSVGVSLSLAPCQIRGPQKEEVQWWGGSQAFARSLAWKQGGTGRGREEDRDPVCR